MEIKTPKFKKGDRVKFKVDNQELEFVIKNINCNGHFFFYSSSYGYEYREDYLELVQEEEPRKIIGYKLPYDMYFGQWKKGDTVVINETHEGYYKEKSVCIIPKEIAETWEPVYEEVKVEKPKTIFERVTCYEDALKELNYPTYTYGSSFDRLKIICKALNQGWIADWKRTDEKKWYVFHDGKTLNYDVTSQYTLMPKSLYVKSGELARHLRIIAEKELIDFFES